MVDEIAGRARRLSEEDGTNGPRTVAGSNGSPTISDSVLALATASTSAKQARGSPRNLQLDETGCVAAVNSISRSASGRSPKPSNAAPAVWTITFAALTAAVARMEPSNTATEDLDLSGRATSLLPHAGLVASRADP